jgi:hypothetical protein
MSEGSKSAGSKSEGSRRPASKGSEGGSEHDFNSENSGLDSADFEDMEPKKEKKKLAQKEKKDDGHGSDHGSDHGDDFTPDMARGFMKEFDGGDGELSKDEAADFFKAAGAPDDEFDAIMKMFEGGKKPSEDEIIEKMAKLGAFEGLAQYQALY